MGIHWSVATFSLSSSEQNISHLVIITMRVDHLFSSFILLLISTTGFSAEISVFVQTGDSVQLDIQTHELPEFDDLSWRNDKSENIVKYIHASKTLRPHSSYKNRVDFNDKTFSLTLKNMQKTDSGLYTARTSGESEKIIVTYKVSVIDAVEAPVLTVNSIRSSSDSCTVNFTCRAHDLMIHSSYQNNRCSPEEVTSHEIYTLILNCSEESIICNHSNPVSSKKDRIEIKQLCEESDRLPSHSPTVHLTYLCLLCLVLWE
ncbi:CD48 antigen-like isoform X1 [Ctenopharyngodon idella]|uniref:CD48 antigen-like isoform X1 n=1 Tax=Ctenopharyngodon idella TaxID=7959 RepID=UPI00222E5980|nr:CD48 antigen-like isoform X1 [Ctenopharyngodon idella]